MTVFAIIPARGGSKGIPKKNIKLYMGKPLIYYSICQALESKMIDRCFVTTDSEEIQSIALNYGAEVPFLRPPEISGDMATDYEFLDHFIQWLTVNEPQTPPTLLVQLRPTYPNRSVKIIDTCIRQMINQPQFDSLRTVVPCEHTPFKSYTIDNKDNPAVLNPIFKEYRNIREPYNMPRQLFPQVYVNNAYLDIIRPSTITDKKSVTGDTVMPYIMSNNDVHDIDTLADFARSEQAHAEQINA